MSRLVDVAKGQRIKLNTLTSLCLFVFFSLMSAELWAAALPPGHSKVYGSSCESCHTNTDGGALVRMDHSLLLAPSCQSCHLGGSKFGGPSGTHIAASGRCESCHYTSVWVPYLTVDHNETGGLCESCHLKTVAKRPSHVLAKVVGGCGDCHYSTQWTTSASIASFHGSTGAVCTRCHNPVPPVTPPITYVPISVDDITIVIPVENRKVVPVDPGEAGDASVIGIDSDGNGMRDDVQRFIAQNYWEDGTLKAYADWIALAQLDLIHNSVNSGSIAGARATVQTLEKFQRCLGFRMPDRARQVIGDLASAVMSTKDRAKAYIAGASKAAEASSANDNGDVLFGQDAEFQRAWCR